MEKYERIHKEGLKALNSGNINPFSGFSNELRNRFAVVVFFRETVGGIIKNIEGLETEDFRFILAGRDYPLHSTILEGDYYGEDKDVIFYHLCEIIDRTGLIGFQLEYKYLLIDGANILLAAWPIPEFIIEKRERLRRFYLEQGLKPHLMTDILHITLGRIIRLPKTNPMLKLQKYKRRILSLREETKSSPIILNVRDIFTENTYFLLTQTKP